MRGTVVRLSDGTGAVERYAAFAARSVAPRHVDVWCPPGYAAHGDTRYPVIYMHDGQNLFDPAWATYGMDWGVDEAIARLMRDAGLPGAIVVGIWCSSERRRDYMPQKPLMAPGAQAMRAAFVAEAGGDSMSDDYLFGLTQELKPFIDATYRTLPDPRHTFVMGSSMGGLISLYAVVEYPSLFGGAGCLSTHWPIGGDRLVDGLGAALPPPGNHRLYFDFGTASLDAAYEPFQRRMDDHLRAAGYQSGADWLTMKFDGAEHNESAWRARVDIPLAFLLKP